MAATLPCDSTAAAALKAAVMRRTGGKLHAHLTREVTRAIEAHVAKLDSEDSA